ncbi:MAG: hypothetical protein ACRBK7_19300 [Acidimicrobiales bacterium]
MSQLPPFNQLLSDSTFSELHTRVIAAPIETVWPQCLAVTAADVKLIGPLIALRGLPARVTRQRAPSISAARPLIDVFTDEGFVVLRRDTSPHGGAASVVFGAAGRFWSVTGNAPIAFDDADDFVSFDRPGYAKTVARLDAIDLGDGTTRVETETLVTGTDPDSTKRFAWYWRLIRLPSGGIRRSWLAAIERRVEQ